jgi:hypothetical protein
MKFIYNIKKIIKWFIPYGIIIVYGKVKQKIYITKGYHQISNVTQDNRYPEIFQHCKLLVNDKKGLNILSFGCSVGNECFSLRNYFNNANIVGYDINENNINIANNANIDDKIKFFPVWDKVSFTEFYDIVFAMSVLCRWPQTQGKKNCKKIYCFEEFKNQIIKLDRIIKKDGLLIVYNSNFRFTDTDISKKYDLIMIPDYGDSGFVEKFDTNNNYLEDQKYDFTIFRKKQ